MLMVVLDSWRAAPEKTHGDVHFFLKKKRSKINMIRCKLMPFICFFQNYTWRRYWNEANAFLNFRYRLQSIRSRLRKSTRSPCSGNSLHIKTCFASKSAVMIRDRGHDRLPKQWAVHFIGEKIIHVPLSTNELLSKANKLG